MNKEKKKCNHKPILVCEKCKATWSDPMRAVNYLTEYMASKPALKHNISKLEKEAEERGYYQGVKDEIECVETSGEHLDLQIKLKQKGDE